MAYPYKVKKLAKIVGQRPRMLTACVVLGCAVITIYSTSFPHLVALVFWLLVGYASLPLRQLWSDPPPTPPAIHT